MDALQTTTLSMIRSALWGEPFVREDGISDKELFNEASRYEIAGFLSGKLDDFCGNDAVVRKKWSKKALYDYHKSLRVLSAQVALCNLLKDYDINPVFLKGMASAWYYPDPLLRQIGDIDFLVLPEKFDECCRVLEENGYERGVDVIRHLEYWKQEIAYECHRYFSLNKTKYDKREDEILYEGCRNFLTRDVDGKKYYTMPDAEYGLVLLEHMKQHLYDGMGFRQFTDWVVYADKVLDDAMWEKNFFNMAKQCDLERFAKVSTRTAQIYLGLRCDNISWCSDVDEKICKRLIEFIFSCDNFGVANEGKEAVHTVGTIFRKGFFNTLDTNSLIHIPIAKEFIVLRPVAWIYQIFRWGINGTRKLVMNRDKGFVSIKEVNSHKQLLKDLGV